MIKRFFVSMGNAVSCKDDADKQIETIQELNLHESEEIMDQNYQTNKFNIHTEHLELTERADDGHIELIVIGGGSAGLSCGMEAAKLGMSVAVVNYVNPTEYGIRWGLGGTCLHVGCIPKYFFHQAADQIREVKLRKAFGVSEGGKSAEDFGWEKLVETSKSYIKGEAFLMGKNARKKDVKVYNYFAKFIDERKIGLFKKWNSLKASKIISADNFLIATGERPLRSIEGYEGLEFAITTDDFFKVKIRPKTALVLGGGYIAAEVVSVLAGFGVESRIYHRSELVRCKLFFLFDKFKLLIVILFRKCVNALRLKVWRLELISEG